MCGFLLYIIGFGAVSMKLFLVGVKKLCAKTNNDNDRPYP